MVVFGIDPGSTVTAYGVVQHHRGRLRYIDSGFIRTKASEPMEIRLKKIYQGLMSALETHELDAVAIEAIFQHKSSVSALKLGQARGVALLAVGQQGFTPYEYNPMTVKRSVGAHGRADKNGIARMVSMLLGHAPEGPHDITDALAIAITHCQQSRLTQLGMRT
jgi:crossover junction endodeoxyribonuclease RuvC